MTKQDTGWHRYRYEMDHRPGQGAYGLGHTPEEAIANAKKAAYWFRTPIATRLAEWDARKGWIEINEGEGR